MALADMDVNLKDGYRAERKLLITVVEWDNTEYGGSENERELVGRRVEDSSLEFNTEVNTSTDILGITYTDIEKMEPTQSFDTFSVMGGSKWGAYLTRKSLLREKEDLNNTITVYTITAFLGEADKHFCIKEHNCSVDVQSLGGDSHVNIPFVLHYSGNIDTGTVNTGANGKLNIGFEFTPDESSATAQASRVTQASSIFNSNDDE